MASQEQLNERQREILAWLSKGLSDQEIADQLFLSVNTIKWHNRRIYRTLGVSNRTEAVDRARTLGVLAETTRSPRSDLSSEESLASDWKKPRQRIFFTNTRDGTQIAYAVAGSGPPLVKVGNYLSHLEYDWSSPVWRHWLEELSHDHRLIHYDERGSGLSDWDVEDLSFDAWVSDLEAVIDDVELSQVPLFAMSQAGAVAIAYAARYPERVSCLILHGAYARGWLHRDLTEEQTEEERLMIRLMRVGWGRDNPAFRRVFATQLFPEATTEQLRALEYQMLVSASPENAVRLESEMHQVDVGHLAPQIKVPTLIFHPRNDAVVPFDEGRHLASLIPQAQFVPLVSKNHLLTEEEPAWQKFVRTKRDFLNKHCKD